jgi:lysophospholipase L1-like esterase
MNDYSKGRRDFIRKAGAGSALALGLSQVVSEAYAAVPPTKISIKNNDIILFQGDSITDAGRNREDKNPNSTRGLGNGYPLLATSELLYGNAGKNIQIYNRGVSGNKVYQLAERWSEDCLDLKPTILSILVGVNDFWHTLKWNYNGTIETYRNDFKALLQKTKEQLPGVKLIIGEPFAVNGIKSVDNDWFPKFYDYQKAAKEVAAQFDAVFIPYQSIFDKAMKSAPGSYWTGDGVHPSLAGAQLMAHAWLKAVGS